MGRRLGAVAALTAAACKDGGGDGTGEEEPIADYACVHIAEGDLVDSAAERDGAPSIAAGRTPYRVNLISNEVRYVAFTGSGALTLLADAEDAVPAWWDGETRNELTGSPNPTCEDDLPYVATFTANGAGWLELGPIFQGNVWLMLGS